MKLFVIQGYLPKLMMNMVKERMGELVVNALSDDAHSNMNYCDFYCLVFTP